MTEIRLITEPTVIVPERQVNPVDPETLRFAATLMCMSCRRFATGVAPGAGSDGQAIDVVESFFARYPTVLPSEPPHEVPKSKTSFWHRGIDDDRRVFWHRGIDGDRWVEWPCEASQIWEYLKSEKAKGNADDRNSTDH